MGFSRLFARLAVACALLAPGIASAAPNLCTTGVAEAERTHGIPEGLLLAMAIQESGVSGQPYPWALNLGGRVVYASTQDAAQKILGERRAKGRKNLYAGCMQLSVFHHGRAFASLRDLLQPQRNVAYAARYLAAHYDDYGDWQAAVRRYQGGKARQSAAYFCRVLRTLGEIRPATARSLDTGRCGLLPAIAATPEPEPARSPLSREDLRELT
ncbi:MAG: lytic transglycosylase domain-containing protein [Alphaproteobacteria bacterium]|nr:lytic transglycosylase domain-containing protein [Alphaproteobacteria bacterium]